MPFNPAQAKIPTSVGAITIILQDIPGAPNTLEGGYFPAVQSAIYEVVVLDQNGQRFPTEGDSGDLVPALNNEDIAWLVDFLRRMRALAQGLIPQP